MCGLCGVFGHVGLNEKKFLKHLQVCSQLRGIDSSGVALAFQDRSKMTPRVLTALGGFESLVDSHPTVFDVNDWTLNSHQIQCVIGHHRHATKGAVNIDNAHPFLFSNIMGCHNGTVHNTHTLEDSNYTDTDSENILRSLNEDVKNVQKTVEFLNGAWALTWYDMRDESLHVLRNAERTLFTLKSKDGKTMFWASEVWMLMSAALRSTLQMEEKVHDVKQDKHRVYVIGDKGVVELKTSTKAKGGQTRNFTTGTGNKSRTYTPTQYPAPARVGVPHNHYPASALPKYTNNVIEFEETYAKTTGGIYITRRSYEERTKSGCTYCSDPITWDQRKEITWFDPEYPVCKDCETCTQEMIEKANATGTKAVN